MRKRTNRPARTDSCRACFPRKDQGAGTPYAPLILSEDPSPLPGTDHVFRKSSRFIYRGREGNTINWNGYGRRFRVQFRNIGSIQFVANRAGLTRSGSPEDSILPRNGPDQAQNFCSLFSSDPYSPSRFPPPFKLPPPTTPLS